jgi:hypothetical protein
MKIKIKRIKIEGYVPNRTTLQIATFNTYLYNVLHSYKLMSKHTKVVREQQRKQQEMITSSVETILRLSALQNPSLVIV